MVSVAVPRQLFTGLSPWRFEFNPRLIHVGFLVDKVPLEQVFLRVLRAYSPRIYPPLILYPFIPVSLTSYTLNILKKRSKNVYNIIPIHVHLICFENLGTNDGFESHQLKTLRTKFMTQDLLEVMSPVLTPLRFPTDSLKKLCVTCFFRPTYTAVID